MDKIIVIEGLGTDYVSPLLLVHIRKMFQVFHEELNFMQTSESPMEEECEIHEVDDEEEPMDTSNDSSMEGQWRRVSGDVFYEKPPQAMDMSSSPIEWPSDRRVINALKTFIENAVCDQLINTESTMKKQFNGPFVLDMMIMEQICCLMQAKLQERLCCTKQTMQSPMMGRVISLMGLRTSARLVQNMLEDINGTVDNIISEIFPTMSRWIQETFLLEKKNTCTLLIIFVSSGSGETAATQAMCLSLKNFVTK